jgi:hypothetical protein
MGWNFKALRADVKTAFGRDQEHLLEPCLQSLDHRLYFQRYHYQESNALIDSVMAGKTTELDRIRVLLGGTDEDEHKFHFMRLKAAAHVTACVASMHAMADILGHAIYYALCMNLDPKVKLKPARVTIHSVLENLPAGELRDRVEELVTDAGFVYIQDLNNHSKHRSLVPMPYSVDLSGEDEYPHGLKFAAFEMNGRTHDARWVDLTLNVEYDRQQRLISAIGQAINALAADSSKAAGGP